MCKPQTIANINYDLRNAKDRKEILMGSFHLYARHDRRADMKFSTVKPVKGVIMRDRFVKSKYCLKVNPGSEKRN